MNVKGMETKDLKALGFDIQNQLMEYQNALQLIHVELKERAEKEAKEKSDAAPKED
jgi:hypothetical protein